MDTEEGAMIKQLPTRLDRYPAKMVGRLANQLVARYAFDATRVLDPFCGSGAVLTAAARAGIDVTGIDLNPVGVLLAKTKLNGFDPVVGADLLEATIDQAQSGSRMEVIDWGSKDYWFTPKTIEKYERLRFALISTSTRANPRERVAILLSVALSVRLCSKADQRSPKPFISATARANRAARHFDPYGVVRSIFAELCALYGNRAFQVDSNVVMGDVVRCHAFDSKIGAHSHVITSPPYINAQDYFRNFKLELHVLQGLLPFAIAQIKEKFVGTDRGNLIDETSKERIKEVRRLVRGMKALESRSPRLGAVVHRYFQDMDSVFDRLEEWISPAGRLVLVCGDNLVGGLKIRTWEVLQKMLLQRGFGVVDTFADQIRDRMLPPKRSGHKGLIKEEIVCCYEKCR